jgi:molybdate transport system substrate-binding protein
MRSFLLVAAMVVAPMTASADTVRLYAAGSLKAVMADIARDFEKQANGATKVETVLGASGLLRERIEKGKAAHVFASADIGHPKRLGDQGRTAGPPVVFARNELCALARGGLAVTTDTLLDRMLDPAIKLGTSTPKADPSGDYAFALFGKAEALKSGTKAALEAKALTLTGGPTSERAPGERNLYAWVMESGNADIFLTYCTNAVLAKAEVPSLSIVAIPKAINVGADYGLIVMKDAPKAAHDLAAFIRSAAGKAALAKHGFGAGD